MTATFIVNSPNTSINFVYTALTANMISVVGDCAEYLYNHGYGDQTILFSAYTNQQKLNMVDLYLKDCVVNAANSMKSNRAQDAARTTQDASKYSL
jgi:hypothetical protein